MELRLASVMTGSVHDDEDGGSRFLRLYLKLHDFPGLSLPSHAWIELPRSEFLTPVHGAGKFLAPSSKFLCFLLLLLPCVLSRKTTLPFRPGPVWHR